MVEGPKDIYPGEVCETVIEKIDMSNRDICGFAVKDERLISSSRYPNSMKKDNILQKYLFNTLYRNNLLRKLDRYVNVKESDIGGLFNFAVKKGWIRRPMYVGKHRKVVGR